jgi:hypothetical protein
LSRSAFSAVEVVAITRAPSTLAPIAFAPRSTHAFGVAETVELARSLGRLPGYLVAYLIEGERFETGAPFSRGLVLDQHLGRVVKVARAAAVKTGSKRKIAP